MYCDDDDDDVYKRKRIDDVIDERSLRNREIFMWGGVDDESAEKIVKRILYLDSLNSDDIKLFTKIMDELAKREKEDDDKSTTN